MSPKSSHTKSKRALWIALGASGVMVGFGLCLIEGITLSLATRRMVWPLLRLLFFITIGLALGQVIETTGWTRTLGRLGAPLFRFSRLGSRCSAAFTTAFISGTAANAMLYDFWREDRIDRRQLFLTNLANQLPAFFLHLPTTVFIVLPLTGWAGGLYFLLTLLAAALRVAVVLIVARWWLPAGEVEMSDKREGELKKREGGEYWQVMKEKLPRRLANVATYVVPIYIAVFLLNHAGLFEWTRKWLAHGVTDALVPVESLSLVVLSFAAEFTSGFATAGALLQQGVLTVKEAALALLIGNIVAFPIRALRHQLPRLMGIFAPVMGMQLLLLGQGCRIMSLVIAGSVYYLFF